MPFQPGQRANPLGRPKRYWITEKRRMAEARKSFQKLCDIRDEKIKEREFNKETGEFYDVVASVKEVRESAKTIMAYAVGMPAQHVELTGADGGPIETLDRAALIELSKNPEALELARKLGELRIAPLHNGNSNGSVPPE